MIPKLIHQTAKTADIPPQWINYQRLLQKLHPDWTYRLWTDADNQLFVRENYPDFLETFNKLPRNIMRADVIRYLLMYKLGGLYMDLDYEMLKPFDLLNHDIVLPWESDGQFGPGNDKVCNSFFASTPGHPIWKMAIDDLAANPPMDVSVDVETLTGPIFLTRILRKAKSQGMEVYSPPRELFNPPTPASPQAYRAIVKKNVAYGIHHCHGTWRHLTMKDRIKGKLSSIYHRLFDKP